MGGVPVKRSGPWFAAALAIVGALGVVLGVLFGVTWRPHGAPIGQIVRVIDGDTVELRRVGGGVFPNTAGTIEVRLLGVDAPDDCPQSECLCQWKDEATTYLEQRDSSARFVVELYGQEGHNRWLAVLRPAGAKVPSLNEQIVRDGYALIYKVGDSQLGTPPTFEKGSLLEEDAGILRAFEDSLLAAQVQAALSRNGMWSEEKYDDGVHIVAIRYWGADECVVLGNFGTSAASLSALQVRDDAPKRPSTITVGDMTLQAGETVSVLCPSGTWRDVKVNDGTSDSEDKSNKAFLIDLAADPSGSQPVPDYCYSGF